MRTHIVAAALVAAACGGSSVAVRHTVGPDGSPMVAIRCRYQDDCLAAAGRECPHGYQREEETSQQEARYSGGAFVNRSGGFASSSGESSNVNVLLIHCKGRPRPVASCGQDFDAHGCQGTSRWVDATGACEPCTPEE